METVAAKRTQFHDQYAVFSLAFSPDGSLLASAHGVNQDDRIIRIWNTSTGTIAGDIAEHFGGSGSLQYAALAFSLDGRFLIRAQGGWHVEGTGTNHVFVDSFVVHDATTWRKLWG